MHQKRCLALRLKCLKITRANEKRTVMQPDWCNRKYNFLPENCDVIFLFDSSLASPRACFLVFFAYCCSVVLFDLSRKEPLFKMTFCFFV